MRFMRFGLFLFFSCIWNDDRNPDGRPRHGRRSFIVPPLE
jgi:hypothetical protein